MAVVRQILHKDLEGTNRYVVHGVAFGYTNLCYVGTMAPMCYNMHEWQKISYRRPKYKVWICVENMLFIVFWLHHVLPSKTSLLQGTMQFPLPQGLFNFFISKGRPSHHETMSPPLTNCAFSLGKHHCSPTLIIHQNYNCHESLSILNFFVHLYV